LAGFAVAMALAAALAPQAGAVSGGRPGTLDPSFGHGGKVFATAPPTEAHSEFGSAAREADGDLVFELRREAREKEGGVREVERRLSDGSLDRSFGKDGRVVVGAGKGLAPRADGDIVVGASSCRGKRSSVILLDPRGAKVSGFGKNGCDQPLPFGAGLISVEADGDILLAGSLGYCPPCGHDIFPHSETAIARLLPDGSRDLSFGKQGVVQLRADYGVQSSGRIGEELEGPTGIAPTGDGGVTVAAGALLVRLDAGGALVSSFGKGGVAEVGGRTAGLLSLPDGSTAVAFTLSESGFVESGEIAVSRFRADGTLDPGFGSGGTTRLALPAEATARAVAVAPGEGILVAGELSAGKACRGTCASTPILARLGPNGQPDPAYGSGGIAALPLPPNPGYLSSLGLSSLVAAPDGSALVAGGRYADDAFAIARAPDGKASAGFGEGGMLVERHYLPPNLEVSGFALDPKSRFTVAAEGTAGTHEYGGFLLGFSRNGRQDRGPFGNGVAGTLARGEIQPSGRRRVVSWWEAGHSVFAVNRHGSAVGGYGKKGAVRLPRGFRAEAIEGGPRGSVAVVGTVDDKRAMGVFRLDPNGRPLAGFGRHGLAEVRFGRSQALAYAALVEADGAVVLTGWADGAAAAARLLPNGRLDRRYGHDGRVRGPFPRGTRGTRVAPFGDGVVIATTDEGSLRRVAGIVRLDRLGRPIRGFGHHGTVRPRTEGPPLALLAGAGRIVVVTGTENDPHSRGGVELRAYLPDGSVDRGFGRHGLARGGVVQVKYFHPVAAVQQRDGRICVAGAAWNGEYGQVELLRFR
jgi:uncharacterized delta-60 repeat protein